MRVGILGATSLVGSCLLPMLEEAGWQVTAFSRGRVASSGSIEWLQLDGSNEKVRELPYWISLAPIWTVPGHFGMLEKSGIRRLVVLSSTSRYTKSDSADPKERETAKKLAEAEERVASWAESLGVEWVILRPTLIYGLGLDRNISRIANFIRRFRFFPLLGRASGLRQPVHARDVASACIASLHASACNRAYDISGGEKLAYREMVARIFEAQGIKPRFVRVPLSAFKMASLMNSAFSPSMAERMNRDLVFDHADAERDLDFRPRHFALSPDDLR